MQKLRAYSRCGVADVILDSTLRYARHGLSVAVEADLVLGGSVGHNLGNKLREMVNLMDFANDTPYGLAPLPVYVDDEGVKAKELGFKRRDIDGFMNNRETAAHFDMEPMGMLVHIHLAMNRWARNTAILPGKDNEDMIAH